MGKLLKIKSYYNFLTYQEFEYVNKVMTSNGWAFGQRANPSSDRRFWYMELIQDEFFSKHLLQKIEIATSTKYKLSRVYANGQTFGMDSDWHVDGTGDNSYTFLLYVNPVWEINWGGETVFEENNEIKYICPVPNLAIQFPANLLHYGKSPSKSFNGLRTTVAFKLKTL